MKLGILSLLGNPWALYGEVKSTSYIFSKTIPAPETCDPLAKIPRYLSSSLSPKAGTVIEKSTNARLVITHEIDYETSVPMAPNAWYV